MVYSAGISKSLLFSCSCRRFDDTAGADDWPFIVRVGEALAVGRAEGGFEGGLEDANENLSGDTVSAVVFHFGRLTSAQSSSSSAAADVIDE